MDTKEHMTKLGSLFEDFTKIPQFSSLTENNKVKLFDVWLRRFTEFELRTRPTQTQAPARSNPDGATPKQIATIKRFFKEGVIDSGEVDLNTLTKKSASDLISNGYRALDARDDRPSVQDPIPAGGASSTTI